MLLKLTVYGPCMWDKNFEKTTYLMEEKQSQLTIYITEGGTVESLTAEDKSGSNRLKLVQDYHVSFV